MPIRTILCSIYEERPQSCRDYPQPGHYRPSSCTYWFDEEGVRQGECAPECMASCCSIPREDGEPGGAALPAEAGGAPCKYLIELPPEEVRDIQEGMDKEASLVREEYDRGIRDLLGY
jgi:hypothetical protein